MKNGFIEYLIIMIKGLAMGAADVVPGVSGGTIAFITGIYERWLNALSSVNVTAVKMLFKQGIKPAWQYVDGNFMVSLFAGIGISVFSLAKIIKWLLATHPIPLWSFFFGLVLASVIVLFNQIGVITKKNAMLLITGAVCAGGISLLPTATTGELDYVFLFFSGALAICAMILPGISGSFILVLIGAYEMFLDAISTVNVLAIGSFLGGAIIGLLSFARLLKYLFATHHSATLSLMTGFIIGSLVKIWPWKDSVNDVYPTLPSFAHANDQVGLALIAIALGFALIMGMEFVTKRLQKH